MVTFAPYMGLQAWATVAAIFLGVPLIAVILSDLLAPTIRGPEGWRAEEYRRVQTPAAGTDPIADGTMRTVNRIDTRMVSERPDGSIDQPVVTSPFDGLPPTPGTVRLGDKEQKL